MKHWRAAQFGIVQGLWLISMYISVMIIVTGILNFALLDMILGHLVFFFSGYMIMNLSKAHTEEVYYERIQQDEIRNESIS